MIISAFRNAHARVERVRAIDRMDVRFFVPFSVANRRRQTRKTKTTTNLLYDTSREGADAISIETTVLFCPLAPRIIREWQEE